ncbi:polyamine transporter 1 [Trichodelitschia bisporula]|uniref:Polyamine transporter 1 n=1 Tax=Trichodelitschia bisporula TaxID=703511 RepID=A0A6G1HPU7_9PEZI|nr:polyamine transporter 1 [Trichodelitschia bisporula]
MSTPSSPSTPSTSGKLCTEKPLCTERPVDIETPVYTEDVALNVVTWDSPDDPDKPTNWSPLFRWTLIVLVSTVTFVAGLSSSIFAPGVPSMMSEFNSSNSTLATLSVSIFVLGLATGPLLFAPLSELYGRLGVQHIGNFGFLVFTIACALATSLDMLIGFRLVQGIFAAVPLTNGGAIIADTVRQEERGFALAMLTMGLLAGPVVGPVAGGFMNAALGWRWAFWLSAILLAPCCIVSLLVWRESYPPVLLARKAERLRAETGNPLLRSEYDTELAPAEHFKRAVKRTCKMLVFSPVVLATSLHMGLVYAYFYLLITTLASVFEETYHFGASIVGLSFLGLGVGYVVGQVFFAWLSDRIVRRRAKNGVMLPEDRMFLAFWSGFLVPVAFFWYGWSAQARVHWIVPIIGPGFMGAGASVLFMSIQVYLIDAYTIYAASALGATLVARSVMAALLPLAAPAMYARLGMGWGNSLLAFLAMLCIPIPWVLMRWGEAMRGWNPTRLATL